MYTDLTQTQYSSALEWLKGLTLLVDGPSGTAFPSRYKTLSSAQISGLLFERVIERSAPSWLPDSDLLIPDESGLPLDATGLAGIMGLSDTLAIAAIRRLHGRIDRDQRARIGLVGELALIELLEAHWPGTTTHISQVDDGFGYDVSFCHGEVEWHLEVKTTMRRGRLIIYLSRNEHEVGMCDANWRLIVLRLDEQLRIRGLATVRFEKLAARAPRDRDSQSKWQTASHHLLRDDLETGLSFFNNSLPCLDLLSG
jgi:hypothetical protein